MRAVQTLPTHRKHPAEIICRQDMTAVTDFFDRTSNSDRRCFGVRPPQTGEPALAASILDCLRFGLAVVDSTGRISFANHYLREASQDSGVRIAPDGRLHFARPDAERRFRGALAEIIVKGSREGAAWAYGGDGQTPDGTVVVRPLNGGTALVIIAPRADEVPRSGWRAILEAFGLTPAEHRLTAFLASGGRLSEAADSFGVSRHTVGNQLRSVFEKTGVTRQADLIRLLWSGGFAAALA
jgi:DNA-binding CsgD family transcriptional regulator